MDSVSHACFSYLVCRSSGVAKTPRVGLLAAGVALLPDLDFILIPFLPELSRFAFHRGPSHSLFITGFAGLISALILRKAEPLGWRVGWLVSLSWGSHIILDMCTGFGVALWWPFSHARSSLDLLFVVDPLATFPLVAATLWDYLRNQSGRGTRTIATTGLLLWTGYAASAYGIRSKLLHEVKHHLERQGRIIKSIHAEPTPFNHQLWYLCAQTENGFILTYRSIWDGEHWERGLELPKVQEPLQNFSSHPLVDKLSVVLEDGFTCIATSPDSLTLVDLRLGKRYGWENENAPFLFMYELWRTEQGDLRWSMDKPGSKYNYGRLHRLFSRVTGHIPPQRLAPDSTILENS
ncbi:metal-dependent hydrolase [Kiritimatiellaeota bacterium B1221]|nr:metal-dependent hydrolase [Kiritimatiellaeota bacterium B1221]